MKKLNHRKITLTTTVFNVISLFIIIHVILVRKKHLITLKSVKKYQKMFVSL